MTYGLGDVIAVGGPNFEPPLLVEVGAAAVAKLTVSRPVESFGGWLVGPF